MCFSVPLKVTKAGSETALLENGKTIALGNLKVKKGDFLQVAGEIAVGRLSNKQGLKVRQVITNIYHKK